MSHHPDSHRVKPGSSSDARGAYDDRDHDYIRSYDRRSNERHHRGEGGEFEDTLDQEPVDPIARSGNLSGQ